MTACALTAFSAQTEGDPAAIQFQNAYKNLVDADKARDNGDMMKAATLYKKASELYSQLNQTYPEWQPGMVKFRMLYCSQQLDTTLKKVNLPGETSTGPIANNQGNENGNPMQAILEMKTSWEKNTKAVTDMHAEAKDLIKKGRAKEARPVLLSAMKMDPDNTLTRLLISMAQCETGEFSDAVSVLQELLKEDASNAEAHVVLGTAYFGLGRFADAEQEMKRALSINPRLAAAHYDLAQIMLLITPRDVESARQYYRSAVALGCARDKKLEKDLQVAK